MATGPQDDTSDTVMHLGTRTPDVSRKVVCAERTLVRHASTAGVKGSALEGQLPVSGASQVAHPGSGRPSFDDVAVAVAVSNPATQVPTLAMGSATCCVSYPWSTVDLGPAWCHSGCDVAVVVNRSRSRPLRGLRARRSVR